MFIRTGIDIVEVSRIENSVLKWKDRFLNRVFTHDEVYTFPEIVETFLSLREGRRSVARAADRSNLVMFP